MRKSFKQVVSGLLAAALLLPGGLIAPTVSAADLAASNSQMVYQETFQNGQGKATPSGGAQLSAATGKPFEGNDDGAALKVSNRSNNWDGVDLAFDDLGLSVGKEYSVTASVYVDTDSNPPVAGKAVLEIVSNKGVTGSEGYTGISSADFKAGQGITLSSDLSVTSVDKTVLRIKSDDAGKGVPFYIGDITITQAEAPAEPTVVLNQSFEDGNTGGWGKLSWGSNGETAVVNDVASEGTKSLKFFNRTDEKAVPALELTGKMKSDRKYDISLKVRLGSGEGQFHLASKIDSEILSDGQKYPWIIGNKLVTASEWTLFETKGYEVPSKTNEVIIYVEPSDNTLTSDIYIDEVIITDVTSDQTAPENVDKTGIAADFENGLDGFKARNGRETVALSQDDNHTSGGKQSLLVTTTAQYDAALVNADGKMAKNHEYELSAWVKMAPGQEPTTLRISVQYAESGFANVSPNATVTDQEWVHLTGKYTLTTTPSVLNAYIETANNDGGNRIFFLDDFALKYVGPVAATPPIQENLPNIKDIYEDDFLIGNIVNPSTFDETRLKLLKKHHNVVTFENDMKPDYAYDTDRQFDFTAEDALVQRVKGAGLDLHGHVLVWHAQSPTWLHTAESGKPLSREDALTNLRTHVKTVVEHFGDQVISWDVVNEAMNDNPPNPEDWKNALRNSGWLQAIGPEFIEEAFLAAKEVIDENGWDIKLYYNDYNDDNQNKATAIYSMVKEINDKYAANHPGEKLIDGIGMQAHYNLGTRLDNVKMSLERFISLGIEVSVTELDIMAGTNSTITEKEAKQQAYLYAQLMDLYKKNSEHISRVTFWGLNDSTSWRAEQNPTLFDKNFQAKEAFYAVVDPEKYMAENPPEELEYKKSSAYYGTPTIDGSVDSVWSQAPEMKLDTKQMAWSGATGTAKALWDDDNLYVLVQVRDDQLNKSNPNVWEQDSVEVFVDENNGKTATFQDDDGQYRVNFENAASFNPAEIAAGFESKVSVSGTNYTVEMKIPFKKVKSANNAKIGFDAQINDAKDGNRISVNAWNDPSGQGYQDTSVFGELTLTGKPSSGGNNGGGNNSGGNNGGGSGGSNSGTTQQPRPQPELPGSDSVIVPVIKVENGTATATVSSDSLNKAIEKASPGANGKKQVTIEVPQQANAQSYVVQMPTSSLQSNNNVEFVLKTENATLQIPSNMLSNITEQADQVSIQINKVSADGLSADVRAIVGSRPVIDLSVKAGDRVLAWNNPAVPITVSIQYTPAAQELVNGHQIVILYIDKQGQATAVPSGRYDAKSGSMVFKTTHFSTYAVAYVTKSFADVQKVLWAKQAVEAMAARDIIKGISDGSFAPAASITRADFITLLVRALELKGLGTNTAAFSDVQPSAHYARAVAIAKELGIASGFEDNTFKPDSSISRQDMMVLTAKALKAAGKQSAGSGSLAPYSDAANISTYAMDSVASLVGSGIVNGKDGKIAPAEPLTRAEAAVVLYRIWEM
ncbi:endo-1,4-beta-xylanase [Paenibacillus sp. UMB7766-LJ446]|uniref:endo-1,4-beta-xylanase n=1 Tax=Paenibacillus sp. UMB7766-LJ446 TaxID=3046313 RepID=UPI00254FD036|nr:endo-1,4-beta-xylanase [Paenibacillus sp. UMB7766-LJ446]MDK8193793.1 endo-1,4-beta-xylanase [Paenibacillus sp. UMB7766-LJ446]